MNMTLFIGADFPLYQGHLHCLCVWRACSIPVTCHIICPLQPGKERLRGFQTNTSRLSNSFIPAGCHTTQQLLLKLSELISLQNPLTCMHAACDSIYTLPLHCAFQFCARDKVTLYQYCICIAFLYKGESVSLFSSHLNSKMNLPYLSIFTGTF